MNSLPTDQYRASTIWAITMSARTWIVFFLVTVITSDTGVYSRVLSRRTTVEYDERASLRTNMLKRWRRGITNAHRERCAELTASWLENTEVPQGDVMPMPLRVRPFAPGISHGSVFPGKSLFSFVRRVYHCCQQKVHCRSVKGIQGRLRGEADVEFLLLKEISSLTVTRAELHLQLSNPHHAPVRPVLPSLAKRNIPTRYGSSTQGDMTEIRVDLQFIIKALQDVAGGTASPGLSLVNIRSEERPHKDSDDTARDLDLGLILDCGLSCKFNNVHILHAPFIVLYYK
ncbi:hypothetical protein NQD34_007116 [Periophthalmus magnuspinnatus]|nr:hypothetical protein NQD34_007116 [Periophthalmus magnuspinnatus]